MRSRGILSLSLSLSLILCVVALAALLFLVGDPARAQGSTRYVATTGADSGGCTNPGDPCRTLQYAVDVAGEGDVLKVAAGTYSGVHPRPAPPEYPYPPSTGIITQVVYLSKTLTIRGGYTTTNCFADPPHPEANPITLDAQEQ